MSDSDLVEKARNLVADVDCGDGAVMSISDPASSHDGGAEWICRYGAVESYRFQIASILSSYDYLICEGITMKEATRRLRLLRRTYKARALFPPEELL
jgi:hypothetical protein